MYIDELTYSKMIAALIDNKAKIYNSKIKTKEKDLPHVTNRTVMNINGIREIRKCEI